MAISRNNPANIRYVVTNNWQGQTGSDGGFVVFDTLANGVRAHIKLIGNYMNLYGLQTIEGIIYRFSPPSENNTENIIQFITTCTGMTRSEIFNWEDPRFENFIRCHQQIESGESAPDNVISSEYIKLYGEQQANIQTAGLFDFENINIINLIIIGTLLFIIAGEWLKSKRNG